jgi:hypothetical protein
VRGRDKHFYHYVSYAPCKDPLAGVDVSRVMSDHQSQPFVVHLARDEGHPCVATVEIAAAGFDISPTETTRKIDLTPSQPVESVVWMIAAKQMGEYSIAVRAGQDREVIGVVVTNVFGLSVRTAYLLTYASVALGSLLSVPWWVERWQKRRQRAAAA